MSADSEARSSIQAVQSSELDAALMLGHMSFGVGDLARAAAFYDATMRALGYDRVFTASYAVGYGLAGSDVDRLMLFLQPRPVTPPGPGFHVAFDAPNIKAVDRFHAAALAWGGADAGASGPRPDYGPNYYAAFVVDPDGYKLEAKSVAGGASA